MLILGYCISKKNKSLLEKSESYSTGVIIKKYEVPKRGYRIRYRYLVDDFIYENNQDLTIDKNQVEIGDKFKVKYSEEEVSVSELIFEKRIKLE